MHVSIRYEIKLFLILRFKILGIKDALLIDE